MIKTMSLKKANDFRWKHGNSSLPHKLPKHLVVYTADETVRLMDLYQQQQSLKVLEMLKKLIKAIPLGACIEEKKESKELINGYNEIVNNSGKFKIGENITDGIYIGTIIDISNDNSYLFIVCKDGTKVKIKNENLKKL